MIFLRGFHISRKMTKKLQKITRYYSQYGDCEAVVKYIDFHIESWFTCIKIAGVQPPIIMLNKQFERRFWYVKLLERSAPCKEPKRTKLLPLLLPHGDCRNSILKNN